MRQEPDLNSIAATVIQNNIDKIVDFATTSAKTTRSLLRTKLKGTYTTYIKRVLERYSRAKSFFVRAEPVSLYTMFVPLDLENPNRRVIAPDFHDVLEHNPHVLIGGSGGSGKSMMMRHLLLGCLQDAEYTPIFIELRDLNETDKSLFEALRTTLGVHGLKVEEGFVERALQAGHLALFLDGFDELTENRRKSLAQEVRALTDRCPRTPVVASSRPDSELAGWTQYTQFQVAPLDIERAAELVERVPYDPELKARFIEDLRYGLFHEHESFLSNPLLLSIMLMTYGDVAHIPSKLSVFYNQAYEALFHKHDALKGGFQRDRRSGLDIQDFATVFAAFSIFSYDSRMFTFSRTQALALFTKAKSVVQAEFESGRVLDDATQAVCLLVEEGLDLTFSHRSFQEYFAARFIQDSPPKVKKALIRKYARSVPRDSVISLLHEMDPHAVEAYFLLPMMDRHRENIKLHKRVGVTHFVRHLKKLFSQFVIRGSEDGRWGATVRDVPLAAAIAFLRSQHQEPSEGESEEDFRARSRAIAAVIEEHGEESKHGMVVPTKSLTIKHPLVQELSTAPHWGITHVQRLFDAAEAIARRHAAAEASLEDILRSEDGRSNRRREKRHGRDGG